MALRITAGSGQGAGVPRRADLVPVVETRDLTIEVSRDVERIPAGADRQAFLLGHPVGWRARSASLQPFGPRYHELGTLIAGSGAGLDSVIDNVEGRYAIAVVGPEGEAELSGDSFAQMDLYYQRCDGATVIGTDLSLLPVSQGGAPFDQAALAHALSVFSWRPPKRHTFYDGVRRLGVGERFVANAGRVEIAQRSFVPVASGDFGPRELDEYARTFLEAIEARGSGHGNVVYLSSGWDSTAILACLVKIFGARKVRAVTGRAIYSERSGVINQVEIDRALAVGRYYGVPIDIVDIDYRSAGPEEFVALRPTLQAHNICGLGGLNHWLLARHVAATTSGGEAIFAGEISDGAHNLGFSQFLSIFHSSYEFREYSDKMASYLYGPSFMEHFVGGRGQDDLIYQIFRNRAGSAQFDDLAKSPEARRRQLLASFFLRGNRLPLWSLQNTRFLTKHGREQYGDQMESAYLKLAAEAVTPATLYSWYLHLYNSFHWQGSTVATLALTAELHGLPLEMPFWDSRLQAFLSSMPESFGRGLDLNPTKYPLKWMLKHRVDYPYHLQIGPHSYLYDVDPQFSLAAETVYASAFASHLANVLKSRPYRKMLSPDWFDLGHFDAIVDRYLAGTQVGGGELNDLTLLCWLSAVGAYGVD